MFESTDDKIAENIAPLGNLKRLELCLDVRDEYFGYSDLLWVVLFLKASALLQKLTYRASLHI